MAKPGSIGSACAWQYAILTDGLARHDPLKGLLDQWQGTESSNLWYSQSWQDKEFQHKEVLLVAAGSNSCQLYMKRRERHRQ